MYRFNHITFRSVSPRRGFTIVEVIAALLVLSMMLTSVMVLINRYVESVMDLQLREQSFELARTNMETLLTENRLSDMAEFGTSEVNPDIEWETVVEPFYEPVTNRMWIRAVCSAGFNDRQGQYQNIELEHWITSLTAAQIKQILAQQEVEDEYMKLLQSGELTDIQKTTLAFLEEQDLDVDDYKRFIERQRREKLEYLSEHGMDGWEQFLQEMDEKENIFLAELGVDLDLYNEFASTYDPDEYDLKSGLPDMDTDSEDIDPSELLKNLF